MGALVSTGANRTMKLVPLERVMYSMDSMVKLVLPVARAFIEREIGVPAGTGTYSIAKLVLLIKW